MRGLQRILSRTALIAMAGTTVASSCVAVREDPTDEPYGPGRNEEALEEEREQVIRDSEL